MKMLFLSDYAEKYKRYATSNFATFCYKKMSIQEMKDALDGEHNTDDCEKWSIRPVEWFDAIEAALLTKLEDAEERQE